jgi:hypothetical protein
LPVQYYVDADTLGLAHILVSLRSDVTYPGDPGGSVRGVSRPPCLVTDTATDDVVWIPATAAAGWLVITRDKRIASRPHELAVVRAHGARMFAITSSETLTNWHQLEVVMCQWRRIEALITVPGPFIYSMTRTTFTKIV